MESEEERMPHGLVQPLFEGPIDIIGDVHGEIDVLLSLIHQLGYDQSGKHPDDRRLVFVGDLVDRGPDSIAVVQLVKSLVSNGDAQCVLGNHELNIMLDQPKFDNGWFFGREFFVGESLIPQRLANAQQRFTMKRFFATLPLALERPDLRVVHAFWDSEAIELVRPFDDCVSLHDAMFKEISTQIDTSSVHDEVESDLVHQNHNAVKLLTSGPEYRAEKEFHASGKLRKIARVQWWVDYRGVPVVYGHYGSSRDEMETHVNALCVDFGVARRHRERIAPHFIGLHRSFIAAARFPERLLFFDDGTSQSFSI